MEEKSTFTEMFIIDAVEHSEGGKLFVHIKNVSEN